MSNTIYKSIKLDGTVYTWDSESFEIKMLLLNGSTKTVGKETIAENVEEMVFRIHRSQ